ncbi:MAG: hypothetical protein P1U56_25330 [Saprospiraceae bacterium]|nr:hypothetical protein [Saprospiraceae bacterium]
MNYYLLKFFKSPQFWLVWLFLPILIAGSLYWATDDLHICFCLDFWNTFVNPFLTILTALIGVVIYFRQKIFQWQDGLPKIYTAHFNIKENIIISMYDFPVSSESEIRSVAQGFMKINANNGQNLELAYINNVHETYPVKIGHTWYEKYIFLCELKTPPSQWKDRYHCYICKGLGKGFQKIQGPSRSTFLTIKEEKNGKKDSSKSSIPKNETEILNLIKTINGPNQS